MLIIKLIAKLLKAMGSNASPRQVAWGFALGAIWGLTPFWSLHNLLVLIFILILKINLSAALMSLALFRSVDIPPRSGFPSRRLRHFGQTRGTSPILDRSVQCAGGPVHPLQQHHRHGQSGHVTDSAVSQFFSVQMDGNTVSGPLDPTNQEVEDRPGASVQQAGKTDHEIQIDGRLKPCVGQD